MGGTVLYNLLIKAFIEWSINLSLLYTCSHMERAQHYGGEPVHTKHLLTDCAVSAEKYSDHSSDVRTERSEVRMKS